MRREPETTRRRRDRRGRLALLVAAGAALAALFAGASLATEVAFVGSTTQVTDKVGTQADPSVSGDIVVFTENSSGNDDVHYVDLTNPDVDVAVASAAGNQRLSDVSGNIILYTDQSSFPDRVFAYDITTGTASPIGEGPDRNPRIDRSIVAFERGIPSDTQIVAVDLTNPGVEIEVSAPGGTVETGPVVSGTRIAYERSAGGERDIVVFDLSDGSETVVAATTADEQRPDIDGDTVVYDVVSVASDTDIAIHDLGSSSTDVIVLPGGQTLPHVSNGFVSYDHAETPGATPDVHLRHIGTGETTVVASNPGTDHLNDLDGNRVVYSSNQDGDFDIWAYEFEQPDIDVSPLAYDFGDVEVGSSATTIVTVSNVGEQPLVVSSLAIEPSGGPFGLVSPPALPATIAAGGTLDVQVAFSPTASGTQAATLAIGSDDLDEPTVAVALAGTGVQSQLPPEEQVAEILDFFDASVAAGTLVGSGAGKSAQNRLTALRNMIEAAGDLIRDGQIAEACDQLADARDRTDGHTPPPDFVGGSAAVDLRQRIETVRAALGCV